MKVCSPLFAVAIVVAVHAPHAAHATGTECSKLCTESSTSCKDLDIETPVTITAPGTCGYGKQYLSALKISSVSNVGITVAFKQGTTDVTASPTASALVGSGPDTCYLTYADVGKTPLLGNDVKFAVSCAGSVTTCAVKYAATWACQPCATHLVGDTSSIAKSLVKDETWILTNPDSCPDGHFSYLKSLKLGSRAQSAFTVAYEGATIPTADAGTKVGTCYYEYGQAPATLSNLAKDVTAIVTCNDEGGCVVQAKPVWGCDAPKCAAVVTGGTDQVLTAASDDDTSSFVINKPDDISCDQGQIAYPKNLVVGGKYAAHNVAVTFNNGLKPNPTFAWNNCYFAYGANPVGTSPVVEHVTATVKCKDTNQPCTFQYKVDSWECFAPKCQSLCTADTCTPKSITSAGKTVTLAAPQAPSPCPSGKNQYLTSLKVSAADGKGVVVAFKDGDAPLSPVPTPDEKKTNGVKATDYCGWTYTNVGRDATLSNDVKAEITCQSSQGSCDFKVDATWKCQRDDALCPLEVDGTDQTIAANTNVVLKTTDECPTFNYLKSLKVGSKSKKDIAVVYSGVTQPTAASTDPMTGACYFEYGVPDLGTLADNVKATVTCAPATAPCVIQAKPEWACDALKCDKTCATGCTTKSLDSGTESGSSLVLTKGSTCPDKQFAYPKNLVIGAKFKSYISVSFTGVTPTATDSSGDCYYAYGADPIGTSAITADMTVTVKCKDNTKPCYVQYKVDSWECKPPSCKGLCTADTCKDGNVPASGNFTIPPPTKVCPGGKSHYLSALAVSAANGDGVAVTFTNSGAALSTPATATDQKNNGVNQGKCWWTYENVGKTEVLTADLTAQVACTGSAACAIKYDATWTCQRDDSWCPRECVDDGCTENNNVLQATELKVTPDACMDGSFNYLKSFKVGSRTAKAFTTKFNGVAATGSTSSEGACYYEYGQVPAEPTTLMANLPVTVACKTTSCDIQTNPEWKCTMPTCAKTITTGAIDQTIAKGGSFVLAKDNTKKCDAGQFAYPKGLAVVGKGITVAFNNGLTPTAGGKVDGCYAEYADPVGTSDVTSDVTVTFTCTEPTKKCPLQYKVDDWGCYAPPTKTYTRSSLAGDHCETDLSKCANRCAKSYKMGMKDGTAVFVPQIGANCASPCASVTTMLTDSTHAANPTTLMNVVFETKTDPMYIDFTDSATACKSTYSIANFSSSFIEETYTRQTVTPNSTDCYTPTACGYRCAAEFALTTPQGDTIQVARPQVPFTAEAPCKCTNTTAYVSDDGSKATGADATVTYAFEALNSTHLALDSTASGTTCRSIYAIKPKPTEPPAPAPSDAPAPNPSTAPTNAPSPTTAKTGTSAGVSAMGGGAGAGVTTVTLIAAAAGVQAVGLPAN